MTHFKKLSESEVSKELENLPEWHVDSGQLKARYTFKDFKTAFAFMTMVAMECEKVNHHPEWSNVYKTVDFMFVTHEAGDAITDLDIAMATYIRDTAKLFL